MYPESRAALRRARRERRLTDAQLQLAITEFEGLWAHFDRVGVSTIPATRAGVLAHDHHLRGDGAVQLASEEDIAGSDVAFGGPDRDLCDSARRSGGLVAALA